MLLSEGPGEGEWRLERPLYLDMRMKKEPIIVNHRTIYFHIGTVMARGKANAQVSAPLRLAFVHTILLTSQYHEMNLFGKDFLNNINSALLAAFLFRAYKN